jgi:hypothetical protein
MKKMLRKIKSELGRTAEYTIDPASINNVKSIATRCEGLEKKVAASLKLVLSYLYLMKGPLNLRNKQFEPSKLLLSPAELVMVRYLKTRTNGNGRKRYGQPALLAARKAKYRCEACDNGDVRVLVLDHAFGREDVENFFMFCADCHQIKSRLFDWTGQKKPVIAAVES